MMLLIFTAGPDAAVPIWFEPSQICNMICIPATVANGKQGRTQSYRRRNHLTATVLKRWAIAGAFSLLTLHRNLAQY
jgi:hypothetical protein